MDSGQEKQEQRELTSTIAAGFVCHADLSSRALGAHGDRAVYFIQNVGSNRPFYEFQVSLLPAAINLSSIQKINFVLDQSSVGAGDQVGNVLLELGEFFFQNT